MSDDDLEALHRAKDTIEWLANTEGYHVASVHLARYKKVLGKLAENGHDVGDFFIPATLLDNDGDCHILNFKPIAFAALGYVNRQIEIRSPATPAIQTASSNTKEPANANAVFVIHGQDQSAVNTVFALLREAELLPRDFSDARRLTAKPMPYIGEVLDTAFSLAQAVLVVFTPDERVELQDRLRGAQPIQVDFQPRPNVLIEAGIALATHPDRTVIVEMGNVRPISDLSGRHVVRWREDTPAARSEHLDRLEECGCQPIREGTRWMDSGKNPNPTWT